MANRTKKETITIGPPGRCVRMTSPYWVKDQCYNSWKYVPTIIPDRDSGPIGVRILQIQDAWERKGATQLMRWHYKILRKWTMESSSESWVHHYTKEMMRGWMMDSATYHRDFQKDGFLQLGEQGDNICHNKWYNDVCSRKNIHK